MFLFKKGALASIKSSSSTNLLLPSMIYHFCIQMDQPLYSMKSSKIFDQSLSFSSLPLSLLQFSCLIYNVWVTENQIYSFSSNSIQPYPILFNPDHYHAFFLETRKGLLNYLSQQSISVSLSDFRQYSLNLSSWKHADHLMIPFCP